MQSEMDADCQWDTIIQSQLHISYSPIVPVLSLDYFDPRIKEM